MRNKLVPVFCAIFVFIILYVGQIAHRQNTINVFIPQPKEQLVLDEYHDAFSEERIVNYTHPRGKITHKLGKRTHQLERGKTTHQPDLGKTTHKLGKTTHKLGKTTYQLGKTTHQLGKTTHQLGKLIISEEEALAAPPCEDSMKSPSAPQSIINIIDKDNHKFSLGDTIRIFVQLKNGYRNLIQQGGHLIHATMSNETLGAYATGMVTDHLNGTYLVEFEALWAGSSVIKVVIDYTREAIAASYRLRNIYLTLNKIIGTYTNGKYKEDVLCHPDAKRLIEQAHYKDVCNYTALNSGHQWYCGSPSDTHLQCKDWHLAHYGYVEETFPLTDCEQSALLGVHSKITPELSVQVDEPKTDTKTLSNVVPLPSQPCVQSNITNLWYNTGRTGFFYRNEWKLRQCRGVDVQTIPSCLKDKTLYLIGDSTVRQWYAYFLHHFHCVQYTEKWTNSKWDQLSACSNKMYNFTTIFSSHNFPYNANVKENTMEERLASVSKKLDKIPSTQKAIVLIHIFAHLWGYHHRYFREKMLKLREGVDRLIRRNSFAKVLLKIPHTFTNLTPNGGRSDISGYIFIEIIKDVFNGLYDKVIYLDNREASTAVNSKNLHPEDFVVSSMINQMFSYVCE